jgi:ATPase subunit of ABC transporter with duplicated ATPase domains
VIVASGIAMQFGAKPLFSDVSVKFGGGNRYGLIGANQLRTLAMGRIDKNSI